MGSVFTEFRPLLDEARRIEYRRKDVAHYFTRPEKSGPSKDSGREGKSSSGQNLHFRFSSIECKREEVG